MAYSLSASEGSLKVASTDTRVLIAPAEVVDVMRKEFEKFVGPASKVFMRNIGKAWGRAMLEVLELEEEAETQRNEIILNFLSKSGFGKVEAKKVGNGYVITFHEPLSKTCSFECGVVAGILEAMSDQKWNMTAKRVGDDCEIAAKAKVPMAQKLTA